MTDGYKSQLSTMSEHLAGMNEKLTAQKDEIDMLKYQLHNVTVGSQCRLLKYQLHNVTVSVQTVEIPNYTIRRWVVSADC